jgi:hypothetical protein
MTFWCGSESGSGAADPRLWLIDPDQDLSIFILDLQDANKKQNKKVFAAYYFVKVLLHHFSKVKSQKEVTKQ